MGSFPVTACSSQRGALLRFSVQSLKDVHIVEIWQIVMVCSNALEDDYRRPAGLGSMPSQHYMPESGSLIIEKVIWSMLK